MKTSNSVNIISLSFYLVIFFLTTSSPTYSATTKQFQTTQAKSSEWNFKENQRSELSIGAGRSNYSASRENVESSVGLGYLGADLKYGVDYEFLQPFVLFGAHKIFSEPKAYDKSAFLKLGLGSYFYTGRSEFQIDFSGTREIFLKKENDQTVEDEVKIVKGRALWTYPFATMSPSSSIYSIIGVGINTHGVKKIFKLNRGEYMTAGLRWGDFPLRNRETFFMDFVWERDILKDENFRQLRDQYTLKFGSKF